MRNRHFIAGRASTAGRCRSDRKRLRQLEEENAKRKKRVADLSLDKRIAQDVLTKKSERLPGNGTPYGFCRNASRRVNAEAAVLRINRGWHRRQPSRNAQAFLRMRIKEIASVRKRYGYRRIHVLLLREGWKINHKRVYRLYREEGLIGWPQENRRLQSAREGAGGSIERMLVYGLCVGSIVQ